MAWMMLLYSHRQEMDAIVAQKARTDRATMSGEYMIFPQSCSLLLILSAVAAFQESAQPSPEPAVLKFRIEALESVGFTEPVQKGIVFNLTEAFSSIESGTEPASKLSFDEIPQTSRAQSLPGADFSRPIFSRKYLSSPFSPDPAWIKSMTGEGGEDISLMLAHRLEIYRFLSVDVGMRYEEMTHFTDTDEYWLPRARVNFDLTRNLRFSVAGGRHLHLTLPGEYENPNDPVLLTSGFEKLDFLGLEMEYLLNETMSISVEWFKDEVGNGLITSFKKKF